MLDGAGEVPDDQSMNNSVLFDARRRGGDAFSGCFFFIFLSLRSFKSQIDENEENVPACVSALLQ